MKTYERIDHMLEVCGCVNETDGSMDINFTKLDKKIIIFCTKEGSVWSDCSSAWLGSYDAFR